MGATIRHSSPKSAKVRTWVETLLGAIGRATPPFDGHCERCNAANLRGFVLVDGIPMILCGSCQQHLRAEGEMAERSYELQDANHMAGAVLALLVAVVGAIACAIMAAVTGEIFAAVAIVTGLVVGRAYRRGAGRVDASGRLIGAIFTLGSVVLGDLLAITLGMWRGHAAGVPFVRAMMLYENVAVKSPGKLVAPLLFGLLGAWASSRALRRPKLQAEIRPAGNAPQYAQGATRNS